MPTNTHQKSFYKSMMQKIHYPKNQIIICGDFNEVIDPQMDSSNAKRRKSTALTSPSKLSLEDLYDPWRCQHGTERDYSYSNTKRSYSRIDPFLTSKTLLQKVHAFRLFTWSVSITISWSPTSPKHTLWCLNISILSMPEI